jgi:hypothetical protein
LERTTNPVSTTFAGNAARWSGDGDAASVAEGATMSDAFGVVELGDIRRESERRGDAAACSMGNTDEERELRA